jgi:hypothetical protein
LWQDVHIASFLLLPSPVRAPPLQRSFPYIQERSSTS